MCVPLLRRVGNRVLYPETIDSPASPSATHQLPTPLPSPCIPLESFVRCPRTRRLADRGWPSQLNSGDMPTAVRSLGVWLRSFVDTD